MDAIETVIANAEKVSKQKRRGNRYYTVVAIDAKIVLNSAR